MVLTAGACLGADNVAVGFVLGLLLAWALRLKSLCTVERQGVTGDSEARRQESEVGNQEPAGAGRTER